MKRCPTCNKTFESYTARSRGARGARIGRYKRPKTAVTCSPDCSKIYNRCVSTYRVRHGLNVMEEQGE